MIILFCAAIIVIAILGIGHSQYGASIPTYPSVGGVLLLLLVLYLLGYIR